MTQQINTCACADRADQVFTGDVVIAKDAAGAGGNLTVENTLNVGTLNAGNIAVSTGQALTEAVQFLVSPGTLTYTLSHTESTRAVSVTLYDAAGNQILADVQVTGDTEVTVRFGAVPELPTQFTAVITQYLAPTIQENTGE